MDGYLRLFNRTEYISGHNVKFDVPKDAKSTVEPTRHLFR